MPASIEQRLENLEIKASFSEDTIDQLNEVIVRQQAHIDVLLREVAELRRLQLAAEAGSGQATQQEPPPHY